jgi:hypothetical protein
VDNHDLAAERRWLVHKKVGLIAYSIAFRGVGILSRS